MGQEGQVRSLPFNRRGKGGITTAPSIQRKLLGKRVN